VLLPALLMLPATFPVFACRPLQFENTNVLHQLRCGGVLEAVRISCAGFPTKTLYEDFVDHFWNLVPELLTADHDLDDKALSKAVLKKANLQGYQCGETKVSIHCLSCAAVTHRQLRNSPLQWMIVNTIHAIQRTALVDFWDELIV
jgi:myosin heavy subunit